MTRSSRTIILTALFVAIPIAAAAADQPLGPASNERGDAGVVRFAERADQSVPPEGTGSRGPSPERQAILDEQIRKVQLAFRDSDVFGGAWTGDGHQLRVPVVKGSKLSREQVAVLRQYEGGIVVVEATYSKAALLDLMDRIVKEEGADANDLGRVLDVSLDTVNNKVIAKFERVDPVGVARLTNKYGAALHVQQGTPPVDFWGSE